MYATPEGNCVFLNFGFLCDLFYATDFLKTCGESSSPKQFLILETVISRAEKAFTCGISIYSVVVEVNFSYPLANGSIVKHAYPDVWPSFGGARLNKVANGVAEKTRCKNGRVFCSSTGSGSNTELSTSTSAVIM